MDGNTTSHKPLKKINSFNELDPKLRAKVQSDHLRAVLKGLKDRPEISDAMLLHKFGFNRVTLLEKCPWLRYELGM